MAILALVGCSSGLTSHATAQKVTLSYTSGGAPITTAIAIAGVDCSFSSPADQYIDKGGSAKGNHALFAQVGGNSSPHIYLVTLKVSDTLNYVSLKKFTATHSGVTFSGLIGAVVTRGDTPKDVDRKATLTGALTCDTTESLPGG